MVPWLTSRRKGGFSLEASWPCLLYPSLFLLWQSSTHFQVILKCLIYKCSSARGGETLAQLWPCNPESRQKGPLGSAVVRRPLGQGRGGDKTQPLLPPPEPGQLLLHRNACTGIGSRCGLLGLSDHPFPPPPFQPLP